MFKLRRVTTQCLSVVVCILASSQSWANNAPIQGSGCVEAASPAQLGAVNDEINGRKFVSIDVDSGTPMLDKLRESGNAATVEQFMTPAGLTASQVGAGYVLLVGHRLSRGNRTEEAAILRAKATGVPIVVEGFGKAGFKALTGLSLKSEAAIVQFAPGGRAQTINFIRQPLSGPTMESAVNSLNRAIEKHLELAANPAEDPRRQAYAEDTWTIWLHTGNVVCTMPYNLTGVPSQPQTGNLDFGVQVSLVADSATSNKIIDLLYVGNGFTPVLPNSSPLADNSYFRGAYNLSETYQGSIAAPLSSELNSNTGWVEPSAPIGSHTVTKTNGFSFGIASTCGANITGPNCSIGANASFSSTTSTTSNIAERSIGAGYKNGHVADPQGKICNDVANGCWEDTQSIEYYLSSTQTSGGGFPINLAANNWYNFFNLNGAPIFNTSAGDAVSVGCERCSLTKYNHPPPATVYNWPNWSKSSAITAGEAGYYVNGSYDGDLFVNSSFVAKEGIFSLGIGPRNARLPNLVVPCGYTSTCAEYVMDLYTDTATAAESIGIDASLVNFSGMPTCAMEQYSQQDLGIYEFSNETDNDITLAEMRYAPFNYYGVPLVNDDFRGSSQYLVGVSDTTVRPGRTVYVALCSSNQTSTAAMQLVYTTNGVQGAIGFTGAGQVDGYDASAVSYDAADRKFTLTTP